MSFQIYFKLVFCKKEGGTDCTSESEVYCNKMPNIKLKFNSASVPIFLVYRFYLFLIS